MHAPGPSDQTVIVGSNGSGKTVFGIAFLATRDWDRRPWVIIDYKRDGLIARLPAEEIKPNDKPPKKPGLYVMRPRPDVDDLAVRLFIHRCWEKERIGLFFDEGYMIPRRTPEFRYLLTQGRSKKIERIILSQRPVDMDRYVFSEGTYFAIFRLTDKRDRDTVTTMVPVRIDDRLGKFQCYFYSVRDHELTVLAPVPNEDEIIAMFNARTTDKRKVF